MAKIFLSKLYLLLKIGVFLLFLYQYIAREGTCSHVRMRAPVMAVCVFVKVFGSLKVNMGFDKEKD